MCIMMMMLKWQQQQQQRSFSPPLPGNIPYAIGIIAGIYSPNTNFATSKKFARVSDSPRTAISSASSSSPVILTAHQFLRAFLQPHAQYSRTNAFTLPLSAPSSTSPAAHATAPFADFYLSLYTHPHIRTRTRTHRHTPALAHTRARAHTPTHPHTHRLLLLLLPRPPRRRQRQGGRCSSRHNTQVPLMGALHP